MSKGLGLFLAVFMMAGCGQVVNQNVKVSGNEPPVSNATRKCLGCHRIVTPGIVAQWERSRHAHITMAEAMKKGKLERLVSATSVPEKFKNVVVGCAECHTQSPDTHADTFEHNGFKVHVVVSPRDCALCHPVEVKEYSQSLKANAYANLMKNPVYHQLAATVVAGKTYVHGKVVLDNPDKKDFETACLKCHGTVVKVKGMIKKNTPFGEMAFPVLEGWPNHGVGRINPDGSKGSCTPCHTRHTFSMEMARKPETCGECHKGPDVPAYKVYMASKHGAIYKSLSGKWNFEGPSWKVGTDFTAPTCAACHMSRIVDENGNVIVERTHRLFDRLPYRLFGIYATPHVKYSQTYRAKNGAGLPLPYNLDGTPAASSVISEEEMNVRMNKMKKVCLSCHAGTLVDGHFNELKDIIDYTNSAEVSATRLLTDVWKSGVEKGLPQGKNPFDEPIEQRWVESWLFYADSIRYGAAMAGQDYVTFASGKWYLGKTLKTMEMMKNLKK
ncbi:multiheme c-type cytochrome [Desulfurobacterium sp.]